MGIPFATDVEGANGEPSEARANDRRNARRKIAPHGQVAEWFKAAVLKTAVGASSPWVRIPPCPPSRGWRSVFFGFRDFHRLQGHV